MSTLLSLSGQASIRITGGLVHVRRLTRPCVGILLMVLATSSIMADQIDPVWKYAWIENEGWLNLRTTDAEVELFSDHLEGYAWAENIGWIRLGSYIGGGPYTYYNTNNSDWGINRDAQGKLSGYAWSENAGWINFDPSHSQVSIDDASGRISGYAWSENVGWISFPEVYLAGTGGPGCAFYTLPAKKGKSVVFCL